MIKFLSLSQKINELTKDLSNLKIEKQLLEIENEALKSTSKTKSDARLDLRKLHEGQGPHGKSDIGYKRPNNLRSPKNKEKQNQNHVGKKVNYQNTRNAPNHAFRYRYRNDNDAKKRSPQRYFNPTWSNNLYYKEQNGWRYECKGKNDAQLGVQINEQSRGIFQQANCSKPNHIHSYKPKSQAQELKKECVKGKINSPTSAFCNYCCRHGHISLECKLRKGGNKLNVAWVPKVQP